MSLNKETNELTESGQKAEDPKKEKKEEKPLDQMGFFESSLYQWRHLKMTKTKTFRLIFIVIGLTMEIVNNFYGYLLPSQDVDCIDDKVFTMTNSVNKFFASHSSFKHFVMIVSSLLTDVYILISFANFVLFSKSTKFIVSLISVYALLVFIRVFFNNGIPSDYLFDNPGFPSLFVPYYKTSSFFFSPTIAILVLCCLEWDRSNIKKGLMMGIGIAITIFEGFLFFSLRKHYVCDIFTSIILSHFLYIIFERYADYIIYDLILRRNNAYRPRNIEQIRK